MLYEIQQHYGKDATLIMGDASIGVSMRHFISTSNIALKRKIAEQNDILMLDEFRSSCINHLTRKLKIRHLTHLTLTSKKDPTLKSRELHSFVQLTKSLL